MKKLFPVIHYSTDDLAIENARIAHEEGANGIFLIEMSGDDRLCDRVALFIKETYPNWFVGCNRLCGNIADHIIKDAANGLDGIWIDNPGVYSSHADKQIVDEINAALQNVWQDGKKFDFFGSVAFKTHYKEDPNPGLAAKKAAALGWIPTTSGSATGIAASTKKIIQIQNALRDIPFAMASGTTVANIDNYIDHVDYFLVATGISKSFYEFYPKLIRQMSQKVKKFNELAV